MFSVPVSKGVRAAGKSQRRSQAKPDARAVTMHEYQGDQAYVISLVSIKA